MSAKETAARTGSQDDGRSPEQRPPRPWRTEGLPEGQPLPSQPRWLAVAAFLLGYVVFFGLLTLQDGVSGPQTISYTEFNTQVANKNVREVFARGNTIEGAFRKPVPLPGVYSAAGIERSAKPVPAGAYQGGQPE